MLIADDIENLWHTEEKMAGCASLDISLFKLMFCISEELQHKSLQWT
jgi:hypothetical protein